MSRRSVGRLTSWIATTSKLKRRANLAALIALLSAPLFLVGVVYFASVIVPIAPASWRGELTELALAAFAAAMPAFIAGSACQLVIRSWAEISPARAVTSAFLAAFLSWAIASLFVSLSRESNTYIILALATVAAFLVQTSVLRHRAVGMGR